MEDGVVFGGEFGVGWGGSDFWIESGELCIEEKGKVWEEIVGGRFVIKIFLILLCY